MDLSGHNSVIETSSEIELSLVMNSFSEYGSEESDITFESGTVNPITELASKVMVHRANNNTSYAAAASFAKTLNSVPGSKVKIPTSRTQLIRQTETQFQYDCFVFCDECRILVKVKTKCEICKKETKKRKDNYFIHIPIRQQVLHSFKSNVPKILNFMKNTRGVSEICDFLDGEIFKKAQGQSSDIILPLTLNVDGAKIFRSSATTLWPIQLLQNYLPPNERFQSKNILLVGLYCGQGKPDISTIMLPLAQDVNELQKTGIPVWHNKELITFRPTVLYCSCDIPARAEVQNCKSSGYFSCPCCEQKGEPIKNPKTNRTFIRFLSQPEMPPKRTHEMSQRIGIAMAEENAATDVKGLKGLSCMIGFKDFDLVDSFVVDYMHGTVIGVFVTMLDIWLAKKRLQYNENETFRFKPMSPKQRIELNRRIISLKPPSRINHRPRSILDRSFFTANEYRALLWFYLRFALKGLLDYRLIKHFELLSNATYTLSKTRITLHEIKEAAEMLNRFADDFQYYYGKNSVTINIHLLRHYSEVVLNCGPLWCHSLFAFEANIGVLKGSFCSTVDVVEQIATNYCLKKSNENLNSKVHSIQDGKSVRMLREKSTLPSADFENILIAFGIRKLHTDPYQIAHEISWKNQVFKSLVSRNTKSIDFFVEMHDGTIGTIEFFVRFKEIIYVMIRKYDILDGLHNHLKQVQRSEECEVFKCTEIRHKLVYLEYNYSNISRAEFITIEPNPYEGN